MSSIPKISVLISTYNDRSYVDKKVTEILNQTAFADAEFLFIETASPEKEREAIEPFCRNHLNCHLITSDQRLTLYEAWNVGWESATAPLVCISNMDDTMHPRLLEYAIEGMNQNQWDIATVLIGKQFLDDPERDSWKLDRLKKLDLQKRPGAFFIWKRQLMNNFGVFDSTFRIAGDKDFWARALHKGLSMGFIPKVLYLYTKHVDQLSKSPRYKALKDDDDAYSKTKTYPHIWPKKIVREIRRIEKLKRIPFCGNKDRFCE